MISFVSSFSAGLPQPIDFGARANGRRGAIEATQQSDVAGAESSGDRGTAPAETLPQRELSTEGADNESADGLSDEERAIVAELQQTDRTVRAHEQAHLAAAGALARGVSFSFVTGPDGQQYAVGGEVSIDTSPVSGNPEATIQKAQQIRAAANAPANPSGQDRAVAAQASGLEQAARQELAAEQRETFEEQRRAQVEQQNGQAQAGAFSQSSASSPIGQFLSLIA
ncbi:MAG: putative metalloprotease CJM1_0395 family protein [Acidobacteria bacterium]|nr:putative metalloprotease CJM1_0395 family protein [Acidobacteriota bacterium]